MTISLQANDAGNAGQINIGATPVANLTQVAGIPFCKNKLFNGEVTRINQRAFNGNWAPRNTWAGGNTIAQQELCYGYDMWAKASATDMVQLIEAGNFRPSTVHTLSGIGVTEQQITSPASGNWAITVPQTARNIQVEEGAVATPFEIRPISFELAQCQRYFQAIGGLRIEYYASQASQVMSLPYHFIVPMRVGPSTSILSSGSSTNASGLNWINPSSTCVGVEAIGIGVGNVLIADSIFGHSAVI